MRIGREAVCKPCTQLFGGYERGITIHPRQAVQRAKKGEIEGQGVYHHTATPPFFFFTAPILYIA